MLDRFKSTLKESGHSFTGSRREVFEGLAKAGSPVTTARLAEICADSIDRATVYRTVELFEKLGIVNRVWHGFKSRIELSEIFTPHHHHAVCQSCGASVDVVSQELERLLTQISRQHNFLTLSHVIELSGYCSKCQSK